MKVMDPQDTEALLVQVAAFSLGFCRCPARGVSRDTTCTEYLWIPDTGIGTATHLSIKSLHT